MERREPLGEREELGPLRSGRGGASVRRRSSDGGDGRVGPVGRERQMAHALLLVLDDVAQPTMDPMTVLA